MAPPRRGGVGLVYANLNLAAGAGLLTRGARVRRAVARRWGCGCWARAGQPVDIVRGAGPRTGAPAADRCSSVPATGGGGRIAWVRRHFQQSGPPPIKNRPKPPRGQSAPAAHPLERPGHPCAPAARRDDTMITARSCATCCACASPSTACATVTRQTPRALRSERFDAVLLDLGLRDDGWMCCSTAPARRCHAGAGGHGARRAARTRGRAGRGRRRLRRQAPRDGRAGRRASVPCCSAAPVAPSRFYEAHGVRLNPATTRALRVQADGRSEPVALSAREWALLEALMLRPGQVLSRAQLGDKLYGWKDEVSSNRSRSTSMACAASSGRADPDRARPGLRMPQPGTPLSRRTTPTAMNSRRAQLRPATVQPATTSHSLRRACWSR